MSFICHKLFLTLRHGCVVIFKQVAHWLGLSQISKILIFFILRKRKYATLSFYLRGLKGY